jgi:3-phosphoshikimate 1-carboxyvinyltransferase
MPDRAVSPIVAPEATVRIPGSKSLTDRAIVCAALADGTSRLVGWLDSDDTRAMREGLQRLGVEITEEREDLVVTGVGGHFAIPLHPIDCRASGTTMRFLTACSALVQGRVVLDGGLRMRETQIQELADTLEAMGVSARTVAGCPPVSIQGGVLGGGRISIDASRSSQFLCAVLMIAPFAREDIEISAATINSRAHVEMTLEVMTAFGVAVNLEGMNRFEISAGQRYRARSLTIEPDASGASYFLAAAAITGGKIRIDHLTPASTQPEVRFVEVMERMGCSAERGSDWISVRGARYLHGIDVDLSSLPDAAPTLAVVACFAQGATTIRNPANPRLGQTDRLSALKNELEKLGAQVAITENGIQIDPPTQVLPAHIATYDDPCMAMSFGIAGLGAEGIVIENPNCVARTFPDFWVCLESLSY